MKIPVDSNVYMIPERLKEIDKDFYIVFDTKFQKYEVHHKTQPGGSYCLTLPYNELDSRTIEFVQKHSVEHAREIFDEIDRHNEMLEKRKINEMKDFIDQSARDIYRYVAPKAAVDTIPEDAFKARYI